MLLREMVLRFILLLLSCSITMSSMESGFTFLLAPRQRECFFETLSVNMSLDLEYQVIWDNSNF